MQINSLLHASRASFTNKQELQNEAKKTPEQKKNGAKLLALGAAAVGAIAIAGLIIKNKHKKAQEVAQETVEAVSNNANVVNRTAAEADTVSNVIREASKPTNNVSNIVSSSVLADSSIDTKNIEFFEEYYRNVCEQAKLDKPPVIEMRRKFQELAKTIPGFDEQYLEFEKVTCTNEKLLSAVENYLKNDAYSGIPMRKNTITSMQQILSNEQLSSYDEEVLIDILSTAVPNKTGLRIMAEKFTPDEINFLHKNYKNVAMQFYGDGTLDDYDKYCSYVTDLLGKTLHKG